MTRLVARVHPELSDELVTKQEFGAECDVNNIVRKYQREGALTHFQLNSADYGYATGLDFHEAMNIVANGTALFRALPSSLRARFGNDVSQFLDFVQNPENADEMVSLGLVEDPDHVPGPFAHTTPAVTRGAGVGQGPPAEPESPPASQAAPEGE